MRDIIKAYGMTTKNVVKIKSYSGLLGIEKFVRGSAAFGAILLPHKFFVQRRLLF